MTNTADATVLSKILDAVQHLTQQQTDLVKKVFPVPDFIHQ
jgi:hypothetical protein